MIINSILAVFELFLDFNIDIIVALGFATGLIFVALAFYNVEKQIAKKFTKTDVA